MTKKSVLVWALLSIALMADTGTMAAGPVDDVVDNHHRRGRMRADLRSFNEVNTLSTAGRGTFFATLSKDETEIHYRLDYRDLEGGNVTQAHIHLGARHTNGGVSVWLCGSETNPGPTGTPVCGDPGGSGAEAMGMVDASDVVGPSGQGIAPGEFAELVKAIKAGVTYVNVHTTGFGGGEIRGQIKFD
jgi:hypothetical protein